MKGPATILSTKKLRTSITDNLNAAEFILIEDDFITIEYLDDKEVSISKIDDILVFTSQHAVKAFLGNEALKNSSLNGKWIFCLEGETLVAVREMEGAVIAGTASNAGALAEIIGSHDQIKSLTFFCGDRRRDELPDALRKKGITVNEIILYRSIMNGKPVRKHFDAILFFSPSGVESFFQSNRLGKQIPCFCIGSTTADAIMSHSSNKVFISAQSSQESVLNEAIKYLKKKK